MSREMEAFVGQCPYCGGSVVTPHEVDYQRYTRLVHDVAVNWRCHECGKLFVFRYLPVELYVKKGRRWARVAY